MDPVVGPRYHSLLRAYVTRNQEEPMPPAVPARIMATGLLKFKLPPVFSVKEGEDAADRMEWYEVLAEYNRWADVDKRANFGIYREGRTTQWFKCLTVPPL